MKRFFSIGLLSLALASFGQEQIAFKEEVERIDSLINIGAFEEADTSLLILRSSLENTTMMEEDTVKLYFTSKLAFVNYRQGDCEETIQFSNEEVKLRSSAYGEGDLLTLSAMRNLGIYYLNCDSLQNARETLEKVERLHRANIRVTDEVYVRTLDDLAFTYSKLDESELAIKTYESLIQLLSQSKGAFYIHVIENYSAFLMAIERFEEAAGFYDELKPFMQQKPDFPSFLRDYYNVFVHLKDYGKALETAAQIVTLCRSAECSDFDIEPAEFNLNSGRLSMLLSNYTEAIAYYSQAEIDYAGSPVDYIDVLSEEAQLFGQVGNRTLQISKLNVALDLHRKYDFIDSASYSNTVLQLGQLYSEVGQFKKSEELFDSYIMDLESRENADPLILAKAYQSLGNQRFFLQNLKDADLYFRKAKDLLVEKQLSESNEFASVLNSFGALYESLVNYQQAEKNYSEGLQIATDEASSLRISLASNLANVMIITNPENDSIAMLQDQAISWQLELTGEKHPTYANMLGNRGVFYLEKEEFERAQKDLEQARSLFENTVEEDHPQYLSTLSNLGLLYDKTEKPEESLQVMQTAKALYEKYYEQTHPGYIQTLNNLANLYVRMESYEEAESLFMNLATIQVQEINESFSYLSESEKKNFVKEKQRLLDNFKGYVVGRIATDGGSIRPEVVTKWYDLELSTKGMLLNATKKIREDIYESGDEELIELFSSWTASRKQNADLKSLKNSSSTKSTQLDSLNQKINDLERAIARKSTAFSGAFKNDAPSFDKISTTLGSNEASVEIIRTQIEDEIIYTALVGIAGAENAEIILIGKGEQLEKTSFSGYRNKIKYKIEDSQAFQEYWKPIHDFISNKGVTKIFYAPDGVYHKISLGTLHNPETNSYLIDELEFVQLTSTKDLLKIKSLPSETSSFKEVLLVGRPSYLIGEEPPSTSVSTTRGISMGVVSDLPGTEEEVVEITSVFEKGGISCTTRLRDEATEDEVKRLLNTEMVHIATHGFFKEKSSNDKSSFDPMINAGLLFAGVSNDLDESQEDGILTAYEIMNLDLSEIEMIVLSACETALGEISSGEGIYGLQRAFFIGGAETLVMSLWKVDDQATKELMTAFYKELLKRGDKREAFINAQRKMKKKFKSPIYWGAFVMLEG